jgi:hypothetical protein
VELGCVSKVVALDGNFGLGGCVYRCKVDKWIRAPAPSPVGNLGGDLITDVWQSVLVSVACGNLIEMAGSPGEWDLGEVSQTV